MSRVQALVGTWKGAFVLVSADKRKRWDISAPTLVAGRPIIY